jgi:hypothetical protein
LSCLLTRVKGLLRRSFNGNLKVYLFLDGISYECPVEQQGTLKCGKLFPSM